MTCKHTGLRQLQGRSPCQLEYHGERAFGPRLLSSQDCQTRLAQALGYLDLNAPRVNNERH